MQFTCYTVAVPTRERLLSETLTSFHDNLRGVTFDTLFLHVDIPQGESEDQARVMVDTALRFFPDVRPFFGEGNFAAAVRWCWRQPTDEYFVSLEDDWICLSPMDIPARLPNFADPNLACVNLNCYPGIRDSRICLSPGLWRTQAAKDIAENMTDTANPEHQLRPPIWLNRTNPVHSRQKHWRGAQYGVRLIRDIGRDWLQQSGYRKSGRGQWNEWVKT